MVHTFAIGFLVFSQGGVTCGVNLQDFPLEICHRVLQVPSTEPSGLIFLCYQLTCSIASGPAVADSAVVYQRT